MPTAWIYDLCIRTDSGAAAPLQSARGHSPTRGGNKCANGYRKFEPCAYVRIEFNLSQHVRPGGRSGDGRKHMFLLTTIYINQYTNPFLTYAPYAYKIFLSMPKSSVGSYLKLYETNIIATFINLQLFRLKQINRMLRPLIRSSTLEFFCIHLYLLAL
jgi:hypothetical protein